MRPEEIVRNAICTLMGCRNSMPWSKVSNDGERKGKQSEFLKGHKYPAKRQVKKDIENGIFPISRNGAVSITGRRVMDVWGMGGMSLRTISSYINMIYF